MGARARITREWSTRRLEGSIAGLVSSLDDGYFGATFGVAFYPVPWGALVAQLDLVPTRPREVAENLEPEVERSPAGSFGVRVGERAGVVSWIGAALFTGLSLVLLAGY